VTIVVSLLSILAVFVYLAPSIFVSVLPGEAGVLWSRFGGGTVTSQYGGEHFGGRIKANAAGQPIILNERGQSEGDAKPYPYSEGLHAKFPWDRFYTYNIRMQQHEQVYDVLASDGLDMKVVISVRWKPIEADLGKLHRDIGPDYLETLIIPIVGAHAREQIGLHRAEELYTEKRLEIQKNIRDTVKQEMVTTFYPEDRRESFFIVENILIRSIELPELVRTSIQEKVQQKHLADAYEYRLERERQEADRKAIEADGIRRFQEIIQKSISPDYLKWKGIDATLELARSNNAKIVVIGAGDDGLPIILGGLDQPAANILPLDPESERNASDEKPGVGPPPPPLQ